MLDHFSISRKSGLVLWSRSFTPAFPTGPKSPVNALIKDCFVEGKPSEGYERDGYSVRWTADNQLGLVFIVVFPALLPLPYIPALLNRVSQLFVALFQSNLESLPELHSRLEEEKWDLLFDRCLKDCEKPERQQAAPVEVSSDQIAKNVKDLKSRLRRTKNKTPSPSPSKLMRKWADSPVSEQDMASLDYSESSEAAPIKVDHLVDSEALGTRINGNYEVADWDKGRLKSEEEILSQSQRKSAEPWSLLSRLSGRNLTREDVQPVLADMQSLLMAKNVAKDISEKLCEAVGEALVGHKLGGLSSVKSAVKDALSASLTRVLTPKSSTDILLDIRRKQKLSIDEPNPYTITFVGVNGVGKSTNLSKVCFWLLQNGLRVLIAACDTFRSGAVEQLRVHVRNLGALSEGGGVELYERGYGKDAAGIAKDAIAHAKSNGFDVVLIDTAGRMQDNEPLMRALAKLVTVNNPDKIVFVGEALVGNEAVDQLSKFDQSLKDFSQKRRGIDGILLTKFDTIDDKVGAALSMTYVTGQPILFVGCGQTYTDLRQLRVSHIVQALLA